MSVDLSLLAADIKRWGREAGFQQAGIAPASITLNGSGAHERYLQQWLAQGYHGTMDYMAAHGNKRSRPAELEPGTLRVISFRMDYLPADADCITTLNTPGAAYLSRYALGRDYHKLIRKRLAGIAGQIRNVVDASQQRAFVDSAPVLERALAQQAGLGWIGKNTMLINKNAGSWFFLGEIFTSLALPIDEPHTGTHCGSCRACLDICPTQAFVGPHQLDATRCISYLTIELKTAIPEELRPLMGNRVFGCDDCQLVCPWNKFAKPTDENDFKPRHGLKNADLVTLFLWDEQTFLQHTEGSAIRRIGYERWLRNLAVGLGNAPKDAAIIDALESRRGKISALVDEHIDWALKRQLHS
jgi:epoxyqueuosine reductase